MIGPKAGRIPVPPPYDPNRPWMQTPQMLNNASRELHPVVRPWPPFSGLKGPLIGWDEEYRPFIIFKQDGSLDWVALGIEHVKNPSPDLYARPIIHALVGTNSDLIKTWCHNFNGPNASIPANEMANAEVGDAVGQSPPGIYGYAQALKIQEKASETKTALLRRLVDAISGKKT